MNSMSLASKTMARLPSRQFSRTGSLAVAVLLIVAAVLVSSKPSLGQDTDALVERLTERYEAIDIMQARFVQTTESVFMDESERFSGTVIFQGDAYRIETSNQTIVTDGITTWVHTRSENQVIINDYVDDESTFSLTTFLQEFDEEYDSESGEPVTVDGVRHDRLNLQPVDDFAAFRSVSMWVRSTDLLVTRLEVIDLNDVQMTFELSEIRVNPSVDDGSFGFVVPDGVEIVDLRAE